jgi:proline iminopeptidase
MWPLVLLATLLVLQTAPAGTDGIAQADDGVRLQYRVVGEGNDVVIVPVAVLMSPHFDVLARSRRVVYYDPRGRGRSDTGDLSKVSLDRNMQDLEILRRHLRLERFALIGFSGYGLEMAVYALRYPDRVTRLVQLAPVPPRLSPWMDGRGAGMQKRVDRTAWAEYERLKAGGDAQARCRAYTQAMSPAFSAAPYRMDVAAICQHPNEWPEHQDRFFGAFMPSLNGIDLRSRVRELRMPRLVVYPQRDLIPLDGVREWLETGSPVRLLEIEGADHTAFLDRPDVLMPALEAFLAGGWPATAH